jgi:hypothetical protein
MLWSAGVMFLEFKEISFLNKTKSSRGTTKADVDLHSQNKGTDSGEASIPLVVTCNNQIDLV